MPSKFPGMDPYLEDPAFWEDFHDSFIVYWRAAINDVLPEHYEARIHGRTRIIDLTNDEERSPKPDVVVLHFDEGGRGGTAVAELATVEPVTLFSPVLDEERETYIEIRRRPDREIVAVLELLSPSNKAVGDRQVYLDKRNLLIYQGVHVVELDLLLGGLRAPLRGALPAGDYYQFVARSDRRRECDVYAWSVRRTLPKLPIPLRAPDPDVVIDLQAVFTTTFDWGRYAKCLAYDRPPPVPLREVDRDWAQKLAL